MMKWGFAVQSLLAVFMVVPAVSLTQGDSRSLSEQLQRTLAGLEQLVGIEQRLVADDAAAPGELLVLTEAPAHDTLELDRQTLELRDQVARLQSVLDDLPSAGSSSAPARSEPDPAPPASFEPRSAANSAPPAATAAPLEKPGYVADAAKLVRACFRAGRWEQGIGFAEQRGDDPAALFWKARCLDKLGRTADAILAFEQVIASKQATTEVERAKEALEFLRWRERFDAMEANETP